MVFRKRGNVRCRRLLLLLAINFFSDLFFLSIFMVHSILHAITQHTTAAIKQQLVDIKLKRKKTISKWRFTIFSSALHFILRFAYKECNDRYPILVNYKCELMFTFSFSFDFCFLYYFYYFFLNDTKTNYKETKYLNTDNLNCPTFCLLMNQYFSFLCQIYILILFCFHFVVVIFCVKKRKIKIILVFFSFVLCCVSYKIWLTNFMKQPKTG